MRMIDKGLFAGRDVHDAHARALEPDMGGQVHSLHQRIGIPWMRKALLARPEIRCSDQKWFLFPTAPLFVAHAPIVHRPLYVALACGTLRPHWGGRRDEAGHACDRDHVWLR